MHTRDFSREKVTETGEGPYPGMSGTWTRSRTELSQAELSQTVRLAVGSFAKIVAGYRGREMMTSQRGMQMEQVRRERRQQGTSPKARGGFTLIELLIVIVIIGVLVGLIGPAVMRAFRTARDAQVRAEVSQLEAAVTSFKTTYGVEPPSRIVLFEAGADGADAGGNDWDDVSSFTPAGELARSRAIIRRIWPQFDFALARDLNLDGDSTDVVTLNGSQCLLFFLGGGRDAAGAMIGFAKNPTNPFATGGSREGPFFEFRLDRVRAGATGQFPTYVDAYPQQSRGYVYFSSNDGRGYRPLGADGRAGVTGVDDDGNGKTDFLDAGNTVPDPAEVGFAGSDDESPPGGPASVYMQEVSASASAAYKAQTFQIISPGVDGKFGVGGLFKAEDQQNSLKTRRPDGTMGTDSDFVNGVAEYDNITNFHGGRLYAR
jgi:prepilin-type N-terminal cleavage/methylation domain-containing protein